jgi:hypothetical protein
MKFIKYFATFLCLSGSLFLLFNVLFSRKMKWTGRFQNGLVEVAFGVVGLSILLFIYYHLKENNSKKASTWFMLLMAATAIYLLLTILI